MVWKSVVSFATCSFLALSTAGAQTLDKEMVGLASTLSKSLASQGYKNVAAVDFTDLQGQPTELGRFLSEVLAVEVVSAGGVSVLDRANIKRILAEHKLTEEGLVNPANAKKLGEFAGVDAILIGNVTSLDAGIVLMVKAISTESARIVAAGRVSFPLTADIQQLLNRSVSGEGVGPGSAASARQVRELSGSGAANTTAMRDMGPLRVVLTSATVIDLKDSFGNSQRGIRVSLELTPVPA